jgi:PD-(D/E)XK nuclease superfamily
MAPTPTMQKLAANISASQYKTWKRCHRAWWFERVCGVRDKPKQHFAIGHALHAVAERYITAQVASWEELFPLDWDKGLAPEEGAWIRDMAHRAVAKGVWQAVPNSLVELPLAFLTPPEFADARGLPLLAKAETYLDETLTRRVSALTALYDGSPLPKGWDRLPPFVGFIDHLVLNEDPPRVADHKTAKSRRYATTPGKLADDEQVLSYAAVPMVLRPEVTTVNVRHAVFIKEAGGPDPYCVEVPVSYEKVLKTWEDIRQAAADMQLVREMAPKVVDPYNAAARANNWQRVKSAVEEGRAQEACSAYGGCPYKDVCFGRATAEQVVRRLDAPSIAPILANAAKPTFTSSRDFRLNLTSRTPTLKDTSMVFGAQAATAPKLYQDVYVLDPENAAHQYRARVMATPAKEGDQYFLALYPMPDIAPNWVTLPKSYMISVEKAAVLLFPHVSATISSYYQALKDGGVDPASIAWTTAEATGTPPAPGAVKVSEKPAPDGLFKLAGQPAPAAAAPAAPATPPPAAVPAAAAPPPPVVTAATAPPPPENPPLVGPLPSWVKDVILGTVLIVNAGGPNVGHSYWGKPDKMGKRATVYNILPGDQPGTILFDVTIDGDQHPNVDARRFLGPEVKAPATAAAPTPMAQYAPLVGKLVTLTLKSTASPLNVVLEAISLTGATVLNGQRTYPWEDIASIVEMTAASIPGSKEAVKAEALQTAVAAIDPAKALDQALEAVQAALNGGKVTKKVLEGILPLLVAAKGFQATGGTPPGPNMAALVSQEDVAKIVTGANDAFRKLAVLAFQQAGMTIPV